MNYRTHILSALRFSGAFLAIFLFLAIESAKAQSQTDETSTEIYVESFGIENGLQQSMVSQIMQDSNGLLWMVTGDGLHCFDGNEFKVFRIQHSGAYNNSDNMMRKIIETEPGIFVIASSSSFFRFTVANGEFEFINREPSVYHLLLDVVINKKPLVWVYSKGLSLAGDSLEPLRLISRNGQSLPPNFSPLKAIRTNTGDILVLSAEGILHLKKQNNTETSFSYQWHEAKACKTIASDQSGEVYIIRDGNIYRYRESGSWPKVAETGITSASELTIDSKGNFWISGTDSKQTRLISNKKSSSVNFLEITGKYTDSIKPSIKHIFEDSYDNLWFGTDGNGLLKYNRQKAIFEKLNLGFVRCLAEKNGQILAGTFNNGLWKIKEDLKSHHRIQEKLFGNNTYILDIETDTLGSIWVVTRKGLIVLSQNEHEIFRFDQDWTHACFISSEHGVKTLQCDSKLFKFKSDKNPLLLSIEDYISVNSVQNFAGKVWQGTPVGLFISNKSTFMHGDSSNNPGKQILKNEVFHLMISENQVWAATGSGITVFSMAGEEIRSYSILETLNNEAIYSLLKDHYGRIWFSGIRGIGLITANRDRIIRYSTRNNLQSLEFNHNAALILSNGKLAFGGINGLNVIDPESIITESKKASVKLFTLFAADSLWTKGIPQIPASLKLGYKSAHIQGSVFSTAYHSKHDQKFSFFLEGYQNDWSNPVNESGFSYRNLPPGEYRLFVKHTDSFGQTGDAQLLLSLVIVPAFWQTTWFMLLSLALLVFLTVLIVKRIQKIRYTNRIKAMEQENALEKERLRISKDMHDDVGASLTRISILSEILKTQQNNPEKSRETIDDISEIAGSVVDELSEIIWAMNPRNDFLDSFSSYVRSYASAYFESTDTSIRFVFPDQIENLPMTAEIRRNLFLTIKEALHNISKHARARNVLMKIAVAGKKISIEIKDDGIGFNPDNSSNLGNGLSNMERRVLECGGQIKIFSSENNGTSISLSMDL